MQMPPEERSPRNGGWGPSFDRRRPRREMQGDEPVHDHDAGQGYRNRPRLGKQRQSPSQTPRCSVQRSFIIAAALAAAPALAQDEPAVESSRATGIYVRGGVGAVFASDLEQDLTIVGVSFPGGNPSSQTSDFGGGPSVSAAIGFQYRRTRTELEYRRMTPDFESGEVIGGLPPVSPVPQATLDEGASVQALMSNVYFDLINDSRLTPYIGLGVGGARVRLGDLFQDSAFAYQGRAGVDFEVTDKLSAGVEWSYFRTLELRDGPEDLDPLTNPGTRIEGDHFASSSVMANVRLVF